MRMLPGDARCDWRQSYGRLKEDGTRREVAADRVGRDARREDERGQRRRLRSRFPEPGPAWVPGRVRRGLSDRSGRRLPIPRRLASRSLPVGSRACGASGTSRPVRAHKCILRHADRMHATTRPVQAPPCRPGKSARARRRERAHGEEAPSQTDVIARRLTLSNARVRCWMADGFAEPGLLPARRGTQRARVGQDLTGDGLDRALARHAGPLFWEMASSISELEPARAAVR